MRIYPISNINNNFSSEFCKHKPNFKGNEEEWHVCGVDEGGQPMRNSIRKWQEEHYYTPYQRFYEKEKAGRMSEYELNKTINNLVSKPSKVNDSYMDNIGIHNLEEIYGHDSYRGAMIKTRELDKVKLLKKAGIKRIIDLTGNPNVKNECKKNGIDYLSIPMSKSFMGNIPAWETKEEVIKEHEDNGYTQKEITDSLNAWEKETRRYIDKFTTFIQMMQEEKVFIGCEFGTQITETALIFDYLFNPKAEHSIHPSVYTEYNVFYAGNLYRNLTDSDKAKMGWTKEFDEQFMPRYNKLMSSFE